MCGFAGILNAQVSEAQLNSVADRVKFRGPDARGVSIWQPDGGASTSGVFFNRLAIMDLDARSNQPFEDDTHLLVFNGEIYNYTALKQELAQKGISFHTTSDTEVLFHALIHWGPAAVARLNGMFAFFFVHKPSGRFIIARDRVGIKPVYYSHRNGKLAFGSEMQSVTALMQETFELNRPMLSAYLWLQDIPTPHTALQDVHKLPPGHTIEGRIDELNQPLRITAFWDVYAVAGEAAQSRTADCESMLKDSLDRQMIADVPLGLFLSSGVDSSLLAAMVHHHFAKDRVFNFYTVAFNEATDSDESAAAAHYLKGFDNKALHHHLLHIDQQEIADRLLRLYDYVDEPFGDPAVLLNWAISDKAREHVTVALSGDGADELFWGYGRYAQWQRPGMKVKQKYHLSPLLAKAVMPFVKDPYYKRKALLEMEPDALQRYFNLYLSPSASEWMPHKIWEQPLWAMQGVEKISKRKDMASLLDMKTYLPDAMLYKVDRSSMASSLEVRVPYLDNTVVDYALHLPLEAKSDGHYRHKAVLKHLLGKLAPHYRIDTPKKGFSFPLDTWLRSNWAELTRDLLTATFFKEMGWEPAPLQQMVTEYFNGDKRHYTIVWYLLNLALWWQKMQQPAKIHC